MNYCLKHDHRCEESESSRVYSPDLQPLMQSLLATLADIDFEYERECEKLDGCRDASLRTRALDKIKERHRMRREPYLQQLAILQGRIKSIGAS